jgi:hypothetical protein
MLTDLRGVIGFDGTSLACRPLRHLRDAKFGRTALSRLYDDLYIVA